MKRPALKLQFLLRAFCLCLVLSSLVSACHKAEPQITEVPGPTSAPVEASPTPEPSATLPPSPSPTPPTAEPTLAEPGATTAVEYPPSHFISYVHGHRQTYELGCEASAAVDWAGFFGASIYEYSFQTALPLSDNPDFGFVGEVTTDAWGQIPPYAYGVHAEPIAQVLRDYGLPALAVRDYSLDEIKQKLSEDKPVIVWVIGNMVYSDPVEYVDKDGRVAIVAPYEHVVILTGYNETQIRYMNNGKFYDTPAEVFLTSWGVLGNMAVIHE